MSNPALAGPTWSGLVDDAAIFPPGDVDLSDAVAAYVARSGAARELVASLVVTDTRLPDVTMPLPVSVVVTGGAGAVAGACRLAMRGPVSLHALEVALRDPDDLAGNAHRVVTAVDQAVADGLLPADVPVFVELPQSDPTSDWLRAADVVAAADHRMKFRTGGLESHLFPGAAVLAAWIDATLDRETAYKCTAGLHHALRHTDPVTGFEHHGFLNLLTATVRAFDGAGRDEVVALLEQRDAASALGAVRATELVRGRRWFTSFGSCSVSDPLDDLDRLDLLEDP